MKIWRDPSDGCAKGRQEAEGGADAEGKKPCGQPGFIFNTGAARGI